MWCIGCGLSNVIADHMTNLFHSADTSQNSDFCPVSDFLIENCWLTDFFWFLWIIQKMKRNPAIKNVLNTQNFRRFIDQLDPLFHILCSFST